MTNVTVSIASDVRWVNFYVDGAWQKSTPPLTWSWNVANISNGSHTVSVEAYRADSSLAGTASIQVTVNQDGGGGGGSWQVSPGATIFGLTGSAAGWGVDTDPADKGRYSVYAGGYPQMGGPLLDDWTAASFVKATARSTIENNSKGTGWANEQDNNYFNNIAQTNPSDYLNQLSAFHSEYQGYGYYAQMRRVDGACPIANPLQQK
ncbi:MAG: hypothetical protein JO166_07110 [Deltaproteobacteria bacterium]|nr:hypothetical protein [Deltaproteobacteria bacterium]